LFVTLTGMASFAGCASESESVDTEAIGAVIQPIIGGVSASDYPEAAILNMRTATGATYACTASLIAPQVVLTAGHCVDGMASFDVFVGTSTQTSTSAETFDWNERGATLVNPNHHDIGLVYLSKPVQLAAYPTLASAALANGASAVNVGRIHNGLTSSTWKATVTLGPGASVGYPFDYASKGVIEQGDSGGPVFQLGTHDIVAVNSGAGGGTQVLARVDLLLAWIQQRVAAHGGFASSASSDAGAPKSDAGVADGGPTKPDAAAPPADAGAQAPACTKEVEPNDTFVKANPLGANVCGTFGSASDVDYYTFTAPIGSTKLTLTGGVFTIGFVSNGACLPVISGQTAVSISVSGAPKGLCVAVTSPSRALNAYTLVKQ
jgi:hypothetical protein